MTRRCRLHACCGCVWYAHTIVLLVLVLLALSACSTTARRANATPRHNAATQRSTHDNNSRVRSRTNKNGSSENGGNGDGDIATRRVYRLRDDVVPRPYTWPALVRRARAAQCTVFAPSSHDDHATRSDELRSGSKDGTPRTATAATLFAVPQSHHALCRKPIVLLSVRDDGECDVCQQFLRELIDVYAAELQRLREHATLVNVGSPMVDVLLQHPYPLPILLPHTAHAHTRQLDVATSSSNSSNDGSAQNDKAAHTAAAYNHAYSGDSAAVRRDAVRVAAAHAARLARRRADVLRRAFAGQKEYVVRAVFLYPHNGSIMMDIVNDDLVSGTDEYVHFYAHAEPFLASVRAAIHTMQSL